MEKGFLGRLADMARAASGELALVALLAATVVGGSALALVRTAEPPAPPIHRSRTVKAASTPAKPVKQLVVHVAGMVTVPGVYDLADGSRVKDAIEAAGGAKEGADLEVLNLAAVIADGQKIVVTKPGEVLPGQGGPQAAAGLGPADASGTSTGTGVPGIAAKVNLNMATQAQLEELPSVGPVTAGRIISYRQQKGRFTSVKQLQDVEGIGPKKFEALKGLVVV